MKALIIILACLVLSLILKGMESLTSRKTNSVGAKSNSESGKIAKIDITNESELKEALENYKDLAD